MRSRNWSRTLTERSGGNGAVAVFMACYDCFFVQSMPRASKQQARYAVGRCLMLWSSNDVTQQGSRPKTKLCHSRSAGSVVTPKQKSSFLESGWLYIPGALAKSVVHPVKAHVQNELKRLNIWSTGRTLSRKFKDVPVFQQTGKLGRVINYPKLSGRLLSQELYSDWCQLAAASVSGQERQLLISL